MVNIREGYKGQANQRILKDWPLGAKSLLTCAVQYESERRIPGDGVAESGQFLRVPSRRQIPWH